MDDIECRCGSRKRNYGDSKRTRKIYRKSKIFLAGKMIFTNLLIEKTDGTYMKVPESKLNPV